MIQTQPSIGIKPNANLHARFLTTTGALLLLLCLFFSQYFWHQARLIMIFCYLVSLIIGFVGIVKLLEPRVSFYLTPQLLTYQHRYGRWQIGWQSIVALAPIRHTLGLQIDDLPYLGIRLKSLEQLIDNISPRLANRLIHEQRPLLVYCIRSQLMSMEQGVINFEPFLLSDGSQIKGPLAGFLHQCAALHKALGYHLFIPASAIDRDLVEFASLLRNCKRAAADYPAR